MCDLGLLCAQELRLFAVLKVAPKAGETSVAVVVTYLERKDLLRKVLRLPSERDAEFL